MNQNHKFVKTAHTGLTPSEYAKVLAMVLLSFGIMAIVMFAALRELEKDSYPKPDHIESSF